MSVRVVARIRPLLKSELDKDAIISADLGVNNKGPALVRIPNPKNESEHFSFQFNSVYDTDATQQSIFDGEVAPTIKHLFHGFDVTLFAYGVTGTGKTHTMRGGKLLADRGIIPRLLSGIYRRARKLEKDSQSAAKVEVSMSYYEIYNDKVYDLFEPPEKRTASGLPLRDAGGKTIVVGLTERPCESLKEFEKLYDQANVNRSTSATKLNAHSSRSHAVLCVKVSQTIGEELRVSIASAIDLAGSEDNRRTDNNKERLVESSSINKSLFVLAQCVEAITKKASRIPYRESKMTRILSLGQNNGMTVMILNLAPVKSYHLDTLSSLNFANRTKRIEVREIENEPIYKGCARPVASGTSLQRQPLRALTSASHNANVRKSELSAKLATKPKLFSVYADKDRPSFARNEALNKPPAPKRDMISARESRPASSTKTHQAFAARSQPAITKSTIENIFSDMVEKKVSEILAARAMDQIIQPPPEISDEVKRRLDLLEKRIESQDDSRTEGLNYLLMAKQHYARGEEGSALKMYELAQEFFPDNVKLKAKITRLRSRLQERRLKEAGTLQMPKSPATGFIEKKPSRRSRDEFEDQEYRNCIDNEVRSEDDEFDGGQQKPVAKRSRLKIVSSIDEHNKPQTPRTKRLLAIINSRDLIQIRILRGVGARKAESIIDSLTQTNDGSSGFVQISSLDQLAQTRGISARAIQVMREGLAAGEEDDF